MVKQAFTYTCDVPECTTTPITIEMQSHFLLPAMRPCAPRGWQYIEQAGLVCDKHKVQITVSK